MTIVAEAAVAVSTAVSTVTPWSAATISTTLSPRTINMNCPKRSEKVPWVEGVLSEATPSQQRRRQLDDDRRDPDRARAVVGGHERHGPQHRSDPEPDDVHPDAVAS